MASLQVCSLLLCLFLLVAAVPHVSSLRGGASRSSGFPNSRYARAPGSPCTTPLVAKIPTGDYKNGAAMHTNGNYLAHVANNSLWLRDVTAPTLSFALLGSYALGGSIQPSAYKFDTKRNLFIYRRDGSETIFVVDYSTANVQKIAEISGRVNGTTTGSVIRLSGNNILYHGYYFNSQQTVHAYDISQASLPSYLGISSFTTLALNQQVGFSGLYYFAAASVPFGSNAVLQIFDVAAQPLNPILKTNFSIGAPGGLSIIGFSNDGETLYVSGGQSPNGFLRAIDIRNPFSPATLNTYFFGDMIQSVVRAGANLWIGSYSLGTVVLDSNFVQITNNSVDIVSGAQQNPIVTLVANTQNVFAGIYTALYVYSINCIVPTSTTSTSNSTGSGTTSTTGGSFTTSSGSNSTSNASTITTGGSPTTSSLTSGTGFTSGTTGLTSGTGFTSGTTSGMTTGTTSTTGAPTNGSGIIHTTGNVPKCTTALLAHVGTDYSYTDFMLINGVNALAHIVGSYLLVKDLNSFTFQIKANVSLGNVQGFAWDNQRNALYYVDQSSLRVVSLSNPSVPNFAATLPFNFTGNQATLKISGNILYYGLYLSSGGSQVMAIDISELSLPILLGRSSFTMQGFIQQIAFIQGYMYQAAPYSPNSPPTLQVFDMLSGPLNLRSVANITVAPTGSFSVLGVGYSAANTYLFLAIGKSLVGYSLANPQNPTGVWSYDGQTDMLQTATLAGDMVWYGTYASGVGVLSPSKEFIATNPVQWVVPGSQMNPVMSIKGTAQYVFAGTGYGLYVYSTACMSNNTSSTSGPTSGPTTSMPSTSMTSGTGLPTTGSTSGPTTGPGTGCYTPMVYSNVGQGYDVSALNADGSALLTINRTTLVVHNATAMATNVIASYPLGGNNQITPAWDKSRNLLVYTNDVNSTVYVLDYSNPVAPKIASTIQVRAFISPVLKLAGPILYFGFYASGSGAPTPMLTAYNLSNPASPVSLGNVSNIPLEALMQSVQFVGGYLYSFAGYAPNTVPILQIFNVRANPIAPFLAANFTIPGSPVNAQGSVVAKSENGSVLYVTISTYPGVSFYALSLVNPLSPSQLYMFFVNDMVQNVWDIITPDFEETWVGTYQVGIVVLDKSRMVKALNPMQQVTSNQMVPVQSLVGNRKNVFATTYSGIYVYGHLNCTGPTSTTFMPTTGATTGTGMPTTTFMPTSGPSTTFMPTSGGSTTGPAPTCFTPLVYSASGMGNDGSALNSDGSALLTINGTTLLLRNATNNLNVLASVPLGGVNQIAPAWDKSRNILAYVNDVDPTIYIMDCNNPTAPKSASTIPVRSFMSPVMELAGPILYFGFYVSNGGAPTAVLTAYNISNPTSPMLLGNVTNISLEALMQSVVFAGGYMYSFAGYSPNAPPTLQVFNVKANPIAPLLVANYTIPGVFYGQGSTVGRSDNGNILYVTISNYPSVSLYALSLANPSLPLLLYVTPVNDMVQAVWDLITPDNEEVWIGTYQMGIIVLDKSHMMKAVNILPSVTSSQMVPVQSLIGNGRNVFATSYSGIYVYGRLNCPPVSNTTTGGQPTTTFVPSSGPSTTFMPTSGSGSGSTSGSATTGSPAPGCVTPLFKKVGNDRTFFTGSLTADGTKYLAVSGNSLLVFDINDYSFNLIANFSLAGYPYTTYWDTARSLLVYVVSSSPSSTAYVVSYANVNAINQVTSLPVSGFQPTLKGMGPLFYIQVYGDTGSATYIYNFTTPVAVQAGIANITYQWISQAFLVNGYAYVPSMNTINVYNVMANPLSPVLVSSVTLNGVSGCNIIGVSSGKEVLFVAGSNYPVNIFFGVAIWNPLQPSVDASWQAPDMIQSALDFGEILFLGTYSQGVLVLDVSNPSNIRQLSQNNVSFVVAGKQQQPIMTLLANKQYVFAPTAAGLFLYSPICSVPTTSTTSFPGTPSPTTTGRPINSCESNPCSAPYVCMGNPTGFSCVAVTTSPFTACSLQTSVLAYGSGAPFSYILDKSNSTPISAMSSFVMESGFHTVAVYDAFGGSMPFSFNVLCNGCANVYCGINAQCISSGSLYACVSLTSSVAPCSSFGNISVNAFGNGLTGLKYQLDGGVFSANPVFSNLTGLHFVAISTGNFTVVLNTTITPVTCSSYKYIGCFLDMTTRGTSRDLPFGPFYSPDYMTMSPGICVDRCLSSAVGPFKYAGLQNGLECWCGNAYGNYSAALPESNCNLPCFPSSNGFCGGKGFNSIYDTGISVNYCSTFPCGPGATCMNRVGSFSCVSTNVTYDSCSGVAMVNVIVSGAPGPFTFTISAAGRPTTAITSPSFLAPTAGTYAITVIDRFGSQANTSATVFDRTPFAINSTSFKYVGCFVESTTGLRDMPIGPFLNANMSAALCTAYCRSQGSRYMALQNGKECWCGQSYGSYGPAASDASCNIPCPANPCRKCGGFKLNSIYDIADACNPNPCNRGETCLLSGTSFGCVATAFAQSKCGNDAYVNVSSRGVDTFSWSLNGNAPISTTASGATIALSYSLPQGTPNNLTVQSPSGASTSFAFFVSAVNFTVYPTPRSCSNPPTTTINIVANRPYFYNGTLVGGAVTYNFTNMGYIVPAGASYTFTSECGGAYSFSVPAPAVPTAPGPVTAVINSATQKLLLTFSPPADLTVAVNQYIISISIDNGPWRKVAVFGSGAEIPYSYGSTYVMYVQAQSCSGLGAASANATFTAIVAPTTPSMFSGSLFQNPNGTAGIAAVSWLPVLIAGDNLTFLVECNSGSGYSVCATTNSRFATIFGLSLGTEYTLRLRAQNSAGMYSSYTSEISLYANAPCATPGNITASAMDTITRQVSMNWPAVGSCTYNLEFTAAGFNNWRSIASQPQNFYTTTFAFVEDYVYSFRVSACNGAACSAASAAANVLFSAPPLPPANLVVVSQTLKVATSANVSLSWTQTIPSAMMSLRFTYTIQVSVDNATWVNVSSTTSPGNGNQLVFGSIIIGTGASVEVRVISRNANGFSAPSDSLALFIPAPPADQPLINAISPVQITQYGLVKITISGLNILNSRTTQCKFVSTAPPATILVNSSLVPGNQAFCEAPAFGTPLYSVTPNAWMVSVSNDGNTWSAPMGLTVTPAPYVSKASPIWIDSRGAYFYLDGQYFDACINTFLTFGVYTIPGTFYPGDTQSMEYLIPPGSIYSPFVNINFYCDRVLIYSGVIAYYDVSATVANIQATTWQLDTIGDQNVQIQGSWSRYVKQSSSLPAPTARLFNRAQLATYGYFYSTCQWQGSNIILTEFPLPYSASSAANNVYDLELSLDDGYTWIPASTTGQQITVTYAAFSPQCSPFNCQSCSKVPTCTWFSKADGKGWCTSTPTIVSNNSTVQISATCSAVGISDSFNNIPVAASVQSLTTDTSLLSVTLEFTFYQSSESPIRTSSGASIEYFIDSLDSSLTDKITVSGPVVYSYFSNFASSTTLQLQFSGTVNNGDLSSQFPVTIDYYDAAKNHYSNQGSFNLLGGATITTADIASTETLFLMNGVSYQSASSYPSVTVTFPSYQFAATGSAILALDGTRVLDLVNATTIFVINHVDLALTVGPHTLTAVVAGTVTSSFTFYVVPAPSWVAAARTAANTTLAPVKGLALRAPFPTKNIVPRIVLQGYKEIDGSVAGTLAFGFPLNGLFSASLGATATLPPATMASAQDGAFTISANIQTVVTGAAPAIQLNSVAASAAFPATLSAFSFSKDLSFLGTLQFDASILLTTTAALTIQTTNGFDLGYGLKATGPLAIAGRLFPNFNPSGQFQITNPTTSGTIDLAFDYATPTLVSRSTFSANVSATLVSTGSLKVELYTGTVASLSCTRVSADSSALVMSCVSSTLLDVDASVILSAFNIPTSVPSFTPTTTQPPVPNYAPQGRKRSLEEPFSFYSGNWKQIALPEGKKRAIVGQSGVLVSDVYQGSASDGIKLATNDNALSLAVWVGFNNSRPSPFGYNIQYATYNTTSLTWTTPASIDPSITVAGAPQVSAVQGTSKFVAAWESQNLTPGQSTTIEQALNTTDIYVGLYLADTGKWTLSKLTDNAVYDGTPSVCTTTLNGDELVAVVWQRGNFLHPQDIMVAVGVVGTDIGAAGTWTVPVVAATNIASLSALSCSWSVDSVAITYTQVTSPGSPATVAIALYANENNTIPATIPTVNDGVADSAPVQTVTSSGQFVSAWRHGNKIRVQTTLLDGTSGGPALIITPAAQPSLIFISTTADYIAVTYYLTQNGVGSFYMHTLASGATAFSNAVKILTLNANEGAIAAQSQLISGATSQQLMLVYTTTILGGATDHHYSLIDLKPVIEVQSISINVNNDGSLGVDLKVTNAGTWDLATGELSAFIYKGDATEAATQLNEIVLPAIPINSAYEATVAITVANMNGGFAWVEITKPSDTYLDYATSYGYPIYTPTVSSMTASASPSGGITVSASVAVSSGFTCVSVVVPCTLSALNPNTNSYVQLTTTTVEVPCGSSSFVQIALNESQITGTLSLLAGQSSTATTTFATSSTATLAVSPFPELVISASTLAVSSPFIGVAQLTATVQNTALFSASNVVVDVYLTSTSGTKVGTTTLSRIASQSSANVAIPLNITAEGTYTLVVTVNPARTISEVNYVNNVAQTSASFARNSWIQVSSSAIRVQPGYVEFAASNLGTVDLLLGTVTVSVGSVSLGTVNITDVKPQYCAVVRITSATDLTADTTAQVTISIPAPLSGSFTSATVSTTVATATTAVLPDCGSGPLNAAPTLITNSSLVAIVGIPFSNVIQGTGVSPFLAPLLAFSGDNLPPNSTLSDPCGANSSVVCVKKQFSYTPSLSDIPAGQIAANYTFSLALYSTDDNSTLTYSNFTLRITSCGNGVKEGAEQCDGGSGCTASCTLAAAGSTTSGATTGSTSGGGDNNRSLRLGLGLGLGLFLPLVVAGGAFTYWFYRKRADVAHRGVEMNNLNF